MADGAPPARGPRLRELGLRIGELAAGPANSISDVRGVRVGHVTVWRDEPDPPEGRGVARTGVTAVVPEGIDARPLAAGAAVLNGAGELTGFLQVSEWGVIETPVYLTATMAVGRIFDGAVAAAAAANPTIGVDDVVIPVVGECDDSWLSEARVVQVEAEDAARALAGASADVAEGAVGAGAGMMCLGWKGGIGTGSRTTDDATIGVLVLANFGAPRILRIDGVPIGRLLEADEHDRPPAGSCIVVVATDSGLTTAQLTRVARRAGLGLARTGSVAHHGSGEIFIAFATGDRDPIPDGGLDPLFTATVDATEEAVVNALWAAGDMTGREGRIVRGLPHDDVLQLLEQHDRLER
ncbi:MAG: P1 family peptidase [Actinomycetota bacterium]|nr:P1 family peptidase [Actinomycetota bacterium]